MDAAGVTPAGLAATRGVSHGTLSVLACLWWAHRMLWPKQPAESAVVLWCWPVGQIKAKRPPSVSVSCRCIVPSFVRSREVWPAMTNGLARIVAQSWRARHAEGES